MKGSPDWGRYAPKATVASLQDMGELAARLGSIVTFDRRGDVIHMESFAHGLNKWDPSGSVGGWDAAVDADTARSGAQSLMMKTPPVGQATVKIDHLLPYSQLSSIGMEISFQHQSALQYAEIVLWLYSGTHLSQARIRIMFQDKTLELDDQNQNPQVFATGLKLRDLDMLFNTIKIVVDMRTTKYVRCILNDTEYNISDYSYHTIGSAVEENIMIEFLFRNTNTAASITNWVDDIIITQNEP